MRTFITGAAGYIGFNVACAFQRAGHEVWGLCREQAEARRLSEHDIHPVIGDLAQPETYAGVAARCSVLAHLAMSYSSDAGGLDKATVLTLLDAGTKGAQPKTLIYTAGAWDYGDTGKRLTDETAPIRPIQALSWRRETQRLVLDASSLRGIVVRNGVAYGKGGGATASWFTGIVNDNQLRVVGDGSNFWAMAHVDDLADGYVRAAESGLGGEAFNLVDHSRSTVADMVTAVARLTEFRGAPVWVPLDEATRTMGAFSEALTLDQHIDNGKAMRLLGWRPRHRGFVDEIEDLALSWQARQRVRREKTPALVGA